MEKKRGKNDTYRYLSYLGVPFTIAVAPVCGYLIGSWLDRHLNTAPVLAIFFLIIGIGSGIREVYKLVKVFNDNDD